MTEHLHHKLALLQRTLLHGKLPRDLPWAHAISLITHVGRVEPHGAAAVYFVIGKERGLFKRSAALNLDIEDVSRLRKLLQSANTARVESKHVPLCRMIAVVDHHAAHVFQESTESQPHAIKTITPSDPHHFRHHLVHKKEAHYQGDRTPEDNAFYAEIAGALAAAHEIIVIGHGVGKSSAAEVLMEHLRKHTPHIAKMVKAQEVADLSSLTEPQIAAMAKLRFSAAA